MEIRSYYDRAEFIGRMLKTVTSNLAEGALLVAVVLFVTLGSFRAPSSPRSPSRSRWGSP